MDVIQDQPRGERFFFFQNLPCASSLVKQTQTLKHCDVQEPASVASCGCVFCVTFFKFSVFSSSLISGHTEPPDDMLPGFTMP